jgi:hypothetical protein
VVVAIVKMTSDRFDLVAGDCVGSMANAVFEAKDGIHELNDESVNTIFGNIGKVPKDPKWGEGPPLEQKEKKVLKEQLQVGACGGAVETAVRGPHAQVPRRPLKGQV